MREKLNFEQITVYLQLEQLSCFLIYSSLQLSAFIVIISDLHCSKRIKNLPVHIEHFQIFDLQDCHMTRVTHKFESLGQTDYINVGDGCWRRNVLETTLRCW